MRERSDESTLVIGSTLNPQDMSNNKSRIAARRAAGWRNIGWGDWGEPDWGEPRSLDSPKSNRPVPPAVPPVIAKLEVDPVFGLKDLALFNLKNHRTKVG